MLVYFKDENNSYVQRYSQQNEEEKLLICFWGFGFAIYILFQLIQLTVHFIHMNAMPDV